jgi:DNA-damage-inducible protein D
MQIKLFEGIQVRTHWHETEQQWYFAVVDVIAVLTDTTLPRRYLSDLKRKLKAEGSEVYDNIVQLKMLATDGKMRLTDAANTQSVLRLIQSIPSPKAEPFKMWLSKVGYERMAEIENPELATQRAIELYRAKGYSEEWINTRLRSVEIRQKLTDEWKLRGVQEGKEYAILTAEISKATFGVTPTEHKNIKALKNQNLRDNMTDLELIFTMLGEASTTEIAKARDAQGFRENSDAAKTGGKIAGNARKKLELETGEKVVSPKNALSTPPQDISPKLD